MDKIMAIKIIKEGKITKFRKTCPDCGCEFEYEASDLATDYSECLTTYPPRYNTYVVCPCCGKHLHHGYKETTGYSYPVTYTTAAASWPDCDCVSDGITYKSTSTSYTVDPKDFKTTSYTPGSYAVPKIKDDLE